MQCVIYLLSQCKIESLDKYIACEMKEPITEHNLSLSDKIYLRYQIEKIFAPIMIDSMYQNIANTIHTHNALNDQATINRLSSCFTLPNVFTRHYIFQRLLIRWQNTVTKDLTTHTFFRNISRFLLPQWPEFITV